MKKLLICLVIIFIVFIGTASAEPFLKSDPYGPCGLSGQSACPVKADIFEDAALMAEGITLEMDLSILYDLQTMPIGEHVYTAVYYDDIGRASVQSDPYLFLKKHGPPLNLRGTGSQSP